MFFCRSVGREDSQTNSGMRGKLYGRKGNMILLGYLQRKQRKLSLKVTTWKWIHFSPERMKHQLQHILSKNTLLPLGIYQAIVCFYFIIPQHTLVYMGLNFNHCVVDRSVVCSFAESCIANYFFRFLACNLKYFQVAT